MDIYFDESRNTGEISPNDSALNYENQRYFVLVGYVENVATTEAYREFKKKWLPMLQTKNPNPDEMKGNDLLRKDNTEIRNLFIDSFCEGKNLYVTVYDKKFFLVTQMINWLVFRAADYGDEVYEYYVDLCEFLIKINENFLGRYISVTKSNDISVIEEFVRFVIDYPYEECIRSPYEQQLAMLWKEIISGIWASEKDYIIELQEDNVPNDWIKGKERNNIVNLTAFGETILILKKNNPQITNDQIKIHHDEIETVQDYVHANWDYGNLEFIPSDNSLQVQLSDNLASIVGNLIKNVLPLNSDRDLMKLMHADSDWAKTELRKIFNHIDPRNTKFVISMREMAVIQSVLSGKEFTTLEEFKQYVHYRFQIRLETEKRNHLDQVEAAKILKR